MKNFNVRLILYIFVPYTIGLFLFVAWLDSISLSDYISLLKISSKVAFIDFISFMAFSKFIWKWSALHPWLVPYPNLNGTWKGVLQSDWVNPKTGQKPGPIDCLLTISQTLFHVDCFFMTGESIGYSRGETFEINRQTGEAKLIFSYSNQPKSNLSHRSSVHDGTLELRIIKGKKIEMLGKYWTSRKTTGDISFKFYSNKQVRKFNDAKHPVSVTDKTLIPPHQD